MKIIKRPTLNSQENKVRNHHISQAHLHRTQSWSSDADRQSMFAQPRTKHVGKKTNPNPHYALSVPHFTRRRRQRHRGRPLHRSTCAAKLHVAPSNNLSSAPMKTTQSRWGFTPRGQSGGGSSRLMHGVVRALIRLNWPLN